jgi:hypothetical protein
VNKAVKYLGQAVVYGFIALLFGIFSDRPVYHQLDPGMAEIKISFAHAGMRKGGCRVWTREEMAKLDPADRKPNKCPRERVPLYLEMRVDKTILFSGSLQPTGFHSDGPAIVYERMAVKPGTYRLDLRLRDSERTEGFDYLRASRIQLADGESLAVDFRSETGGFILFGRDGKK